MKQLDYTHKQNIIHKEETMEFLLNQDDIQQLSEMRNEDMIYVNGICYRFPLQIFKFDPLKNEQLIKLILIPIE